MITPRSFVAAVRRRLAPGTADRDDRYAGAWDAYVEASAGGGWPGDDWGDPELWRAWFDTILAPAGASEWERAVEIGQGTGKYTAMVLDAGCREVLACDVSQRFLDLCAQRLAGPVAAARLHLHRIDSANPRAIQEACAAHGWTGAVDAVFSIDTMVHVDFNLVAGYLLAGTEVLRSGGTFAMTFADGTSEGGFRKMLGELDGVIAAESDPASLCFRWVTPELVAVTAERMGYEIIRCGPDPHHGRDGILIARFADPERALAAQASRG